MAKFTVDWKMSAIRDGRGFHVDVGAFSTPIAGGGEALVIDQDRPIALVSVPSGMSILPTRVDVACLTPLIVADSNESEILVAADISAAWDATGAATLATPTNKKTRHGATSKCTCRSKFTGNITAVPVLGVELAHAQVTADLQGTAANALWGELKCLYEPAALSIIDGPAMLIVYWGGTVATSGFAQIEWMEFPTSYFA